MNKGIMYVVESIACHLEEEKEVENNVRYETVISAFLSIFEMNMDDKLYFMDMFKNVMNEFNKKGDDRYQLQFDFVKELHSYTEKNLK